MQNESVQPISKGLIEWALDSLSAVKYGRDKDDDIYAILPFGPNGKDLNCWFLITGNKNDVFSVHCTIDDYLSEDNLGDAHFACSEYHRGNRFGRAILNKQENKYTIYFDAHIDTERGITQGFLQRFILITLYGAKTFYESACKEYNLF
jgi:hypothetical protein